MQDRISLFENCIYFLIIFVPVLVVMAFITLFERKLMGVMQRRRGPNVVGFFGVLQPIADGVKLLFKEPVFPYFSDIFFFCFAAVLTFVVSLMSWCVMPAINGWLRTGVDLQMGLLFVFASSSIGVYGILLAGWTSNSKYAFFGSVRGVAQMISYEVSMVLAVFPILVSGGSAAIGEIVEIQSGRLPFIVSFFPSAVCFYVTMLAETNRSPFDLPEAEGELVAGYNVEYSSFFFAFFYLAEYLNILLLSCLFTFLFLGGGYGSSLIFVIEVVVILYSFIWIRATLPRYRYDQLMGIGWKVLLPLTTGYAIFVGGLMLFIEVGIGVLVS